MPKKISNTINYTQITVPLILTIVFLSLFDAGYDHNVIYWVLLPLSASMIYFTISGQIKIDVAPGKPAFFLALFWLWAGISIFWSINPHRTLVEFLQLSICVMVFVLAANLNEESSLRVGFTALATGLVVALFGISQYLFGSTARIESTIANANSLGIFLAMLFLLGIGYYLRKPNRFIALTAVALFVALILTMSRGSFISLAIGMPLVFVGFKKTDVFSAFKTNSLRKLLIFIVCALALSQLAIYIAPNLQNLGNQVLSDILTRRAGFITWSGVSRFAFWQTGLYIFAANPIHGTGLGTFAMASYTHFIDNIWFARFAHNHYIQTMAELGIIGAGLLLAFLVQIVRIAWEQLKSKKYPDFYPGLLAAALAFLIHIGGDFSWNYPAVAVLFFTLAGTITAVSAETSEKVSQKKNYITGQVAVLIIIFTLTLWQFSMVFFYEKGMELESSGRIKEAAATYDLANSIYPINSLAYSFAGNAYFMMAAQSQDFTYMNEAIVRLEKAISLNPANAILHNQLGRYYWLVGRSDDAIKHLRIAADYAGYRIGLLLDLAWVYIQMERFDEAGDVLDKGFELKDIAQGMHPSAEDIERVKQEIEDLYKLKEMLDRATL